MIVLDASAVPDHPSGARTRLRGLLGAYAALPGAPELVVLLRRGATLLDGVSLCSGVALRGIRVEEISDPGGPWRRALAGRTPELPAALLREARVWHSETIPPRVPRERSTQGSLPALPTLLTLHDARWFEPRVVTGEPWHRWWPRHMATRAWLPRAVHRLAGIITVSETSARRFSSVLHLPREFIHVIANAEVIEPPPPLAADAADALLHRLGIAGAPFFLAVGHLEPRKGLAPIVDALVRAPPESPLARARLVLVGAGRSERVLRAAAGVTGSRVVFAGRLDEPSTFELYRRACALLFPSRYEGFGFPIWEAAAVGTPILARALEPVESARGQLAHLPLRLLGEDLAAWREAMAAMVTSDTMVSTAAASTCGLRSSRAATCRSITGTTWLDTAQRLADVYRAVVTDRSSVAKSARWVNRP